MGSHASDGPLRIALVSTPMLPVPPPTYAGTERVVAALGDILIERGHEVTLYAPGDSEISGGTLVPTIERSLWSTEYRGDISAHVSISLAKVVGRSRALRHHPFPHRDDGLPVRAALPDAGRDTLHGRLDQAGAPELLEEFSDIPLVADQRQPAPFSPESNWVATVHHGLPFDNVPFSERPGDYLAFVGPDHAREGHRGSDRAGPSDRAAASHRGQGLRRARAGALRRRSSSRRSTTGR